MAIQSILVHLANDAHHMARLRVAYALARRHHAHVTALYITSPTSMPYAVEGRGASFRFLHEAMDIARQRATEIEAEFRAWCQEHGMSGDWLVEEGDHVKALARHSLYADLAVVSQTRPRNLEEMLFNTLPDHLAMIGACPTVVLPEGYGGPDDLGRRVMVAWKARRECARAVRDALPLLHVAESVLVVQVDPDAAAITSGERLADWLRHHGVSPEIKHLGRQGQAISGAILDAAESNRCDLVVMGSYGHSKLTELVLGGTTHDILSGVRLPVMMSH